MESIVGTVEELFDNSGGSPINLEPINSEVAVRARREFILEQRRNLSSTSGHTTRSSHGSASAVRNEQRQGDPVLHHPNLDIPVGDFQCTLAQ